MQFNLRCIQHCNTPMRTFYRRPSMNVNWDYLRYLWAILECIEDGSPFRQSLNFLDIFSPVYPPLFPWNSMIHMSSCVLGETKSSVENILTRLTCLSSVIWFRIAVVVDHVLATTVPALINR